MKKSGNIITRNPWKFTFLLLIIGGVLWYFKPRAAKEEEPMSFFEPSEYIVSTGNIESSLTIEGTTQFSNSQKLSFLNQGKVKTVNVKVGDEVKKGQVLATMTTDDLDKDVEQQKIDIQDQKNEIQDLLDGYNLDLELLKAQAEYDNLLLKQKNLEQSNELEIEETIHKLKDAEKEYNDALKDYQELLSGSESGNKDLALSSTIRDRKIKMEDAVLGIRTAYFDIQDMLEWYDQLMFITDKYSGVESIYIGAKDVQKKNEAREGFNAIRNDLTKLQNYYDTLKKIEPLDLTNEQILEVYSFMRDLGQKILNWGEACYDMFQESIVSEGSLSQGDIDSYSKKALGFQDAGISYMTKTYSSMVETLSKLDEDTSLEDTKLKMEKLKTAWEKMKIEAQLLTTNQDKEKAELQEKIDQALRNINKIKKGESLDESKITAAKNRLKQLQNTLDNLYKKYDDYKLIANFDGVITQMDLQVGDSIESSSKSGSEKYIYVESNNILELSLSVEQVDIIKLKVGMPVDVYLDAYDGNIYHGTVTEINTVPSEGGMGASYPVTVTFYKNDPEEMILAGMGGNAKIYLEKFENLILIPNQAISRMNGKEVVKLLENGQRVDREIETGTSDESQTEVLSGLSVGDTIKEMYMTQEGFSSVGLEDSEDAMMMYGSMGGMRGGMGGGMRGGMGGSRRGRG